MTHLSKALGLSLLVHILMLMITIIISSNITPLNKPLIVELKIEVSKDKVKKMRGYKSQAKIHNLRIEDPKQSSQKEIHISTSTANLNPPLETHIPPAVTQSDDVKVGEGKSEAGKRYLEEPIIAKDFAEMIKARYFKEHFSYIRDIIIKNLSYPILAKKRGLEGKVKVSFIVCENGSVEDVKIIEGSGYGFLDKNIVDTIIRVAPFPKPPVKSKLIMPIVYKLE